MSLIPTPRPPDKLSAAVVTIIILLLIAGGDYYVLTTPHLITSTQVGEPPLPAAQLLANHKEPVEKPSVTTAGFAATKAKLAQRVGAGIHRFYAVFGLAIRLSLAN